MSISQASSQENLCGHGMWTDAFCCALLAIGCPCMIVTCYCSRHHHAWGSNTHKDCQEGLPAATALLPAPALLAAWRQASIAFRYCMAGHTALGLECIPSLMPTTHDAAGWGPCLIPCALGVVVLSVDALQAPAARSTVL